MENIYCDLDIVITELYDFANIPSKKEVSLKIEDVNVSFLENGGFGDIFEYLMSIEEDDKDFEIYLRKNKKLYVKFAGFNLIIDYHLKKDGKTTIFNLRRLNI